MRLFLAIPLPEPLQDELARFQSRARLSGASASWPKPQGMHLTLAFLGEGSETIVPSLLEVASRIASGHTPFPLQTYRLGGFPQDHAARVLWLGLEESPLLWMLAEDLRRGLREAGRTFDDKPFKAHLTLARFKATQDVARFQEQPAVCSFEVREFALYQSVQTSSGAYYLSLGKVSLGSASVSR